jgi:hypothetical protein
MAETPGEHEPIRPISKEERGARKAFRQIEADKAMTDHEIAKQAFATNYERLRAERISREATMPPAVKVKPKGRGK